jgi:hypothetical protein
VSDSTRLTQSHGQSIAELYRRVRDLEFRRPDSGGVGIVSPIFSYDLSNVTTTPTNDGQVRMNNADQSLATEVYFDHKTSGNVDVTTALKLAEEGMRIFIQDKGDSAAWVRYTISGPPVHDEANGFTTFPVTLIDEGNEVPNGTIVVGIAAGGGVHTHDYLPLTGGTLTGDLLLTQQASARFANTHGNWGGRVYPYGDSGREILIAVGGDGILGAEPALLLYGAGDSVTPGDIQLRDIANAYVWRYDEAARSHVFRVGGVTLATMDDGAGARLYGPSATRGWILTEGSGSATAPPYAFRGDANTGIYSNEADAMYFTAGGNAMLGLAQGTVNSPQINASTTTAAANVNVNGAGLRVLARSTSSLKYKPGWKYVDLVDIELPQPITWETEDHGTMIGFGVEHIGAVFPEALLDFQEDGGPENYDPRAIMAVLWAKIQRLEARLEPEWTS